MGKFTVDGTTGAMYTKKRKRVKGADHHLRNEVKQYNPFVSVSSVNRNNYGSFYISNIYYPNKTGEQYESVKYGSWDPIMLHDPDPGAGSAEAIGNQYFLKYLRFKGYINVSDGCYRDVSWRLVLYRSNNGKLVPDSAQLPNTRADAILSHCYKATELFTNASSTNPDVAIARHNFYKKIVNVDNKDTFSKKIIASGTVPQTWTGQWTSTHALGATSGMSHGFYSDFQIGDGRRYIPLDIKVTCNDWVKKEEVFYYIVLETDSIKGLNISDPTNAALIGASESDVYAKSMFVFNFYCRAYFIDP